MYRKPLRDHSGFSLLLLIIYKNITFLKPILLSSGRSLRPVSILVVCIEVLKKCWSFKYPLGFDPGCFSNVQTGAMRIGKDAVILTQTKDTCSMGFLSKSYNSDLEVRSLLNVSCFT